MDLAFITDAALRQRVEDAIEYIYTLYEESKGSDKNDLYRTETYRVIILYTISIIEAVLFYLYERKGMTIKKLEYKEKQSLPTKYLHSDTKGRVIIAVEKSSEKSESEISLKELIQFFVTNKVLKKETAEKLHEIMRTRNSVHLRQKGHGSCSVEQVEESLDFLVYVLTHAPKSLS
jgi:hypothetical protein